jgi:hypothetical protein
MLIPQQRQAFFVGGKQDKTLQNNFFIFFMTSRNIFLCFILLAIISGLHCKGSHSLTSNDREFKAIYIDQFKLTYFRQLLKKSYNNSNAIQEIIENDHSGFTEPMLTIDDYKLIDSLTKLDNIQLVSDSTDGNRRAEGAQGKRPLGFIMGKLRSKWLDSLANKRYSTSNVKQMYAD